MQQPPDGRGDLQSSTVNAWGIDHQVLSGTAWPAGSHIAKLLLAQSVVNVCCHRGTAGPLRHTAACCYALLCVLCHIPFVVVLLDGSSSNTSALGRPFISVECLLDCGPCLQINGPFFRAPDTGPVTLLKARNANYELKMIKMLPNLPSNIQLGGSEAIACRAILPSAERQNIPIIRGTVIEVTVPREHHTLTGHYPGVYAAVLMPQYLGSIEMQMAAAEPELLKGINQMIQAVEHVHAEGFVHMDVKV